MLIIKINNEENGKNTRKRKRVKNKEKTRLNKHINDYSCTLFMMKFLWSIDLHKQTRLAKSQKF